MNDIVMIVLGLLLTVLNISIGVKTTIVDKKKYGLVYFIIALLVLHSMCNYIK